MIMLQRVCVEDESQAYAPPIENVAVDEVTITRMRPSSTRRADQCTELTFSDGGTWVVVGTIDEILKKFDGED